MADSEELYHSITSLKDYVYSIFPKSLERPFIGGKYIDDTCDFYDKFDKTLMMSARDHFKSMSLYADFTYDLFKARDYSLECQYFSYTRPMAAYHTNKIHDMIKRNPYFKGCKDLKSSADSVLKYTWDDQHYITLVPQGLLTFTRGIHPDRIYLDDALKDPQNRIILTTIIKINNIVKSVLFPMLNDGGKFRISGTPQSWIDFYFDDETMSDFQKLIRPAILQDDPINPIVAWPERRNYEWLMQKKREVGHRLFNPEYLCTPTHAESAFFTRDRLRPVLRKDIARPIPYHTDNDMILLWDLGKHMDPSHISVLEWDSFRAVQRLNKFLDDMDYKDQIQEVWDYWEGYGCTGGLFDHTRGEMEVQLEQRTLPRKLDPLKFTSKNKGAIAACFDQFVSNSRIELIDDFRQVNQILMVDNDLNAPHTPEGHSDCFWTNAMGCYYIDHYLRRSADITVGTYANLQQAQHAKFASNYQRYLGPY